MTNQQTTRSVVSFRNFASVAVVLVAVNGCSSEADVPLNGSGSIQRQVLTRGELTNPDNLEVGGRNYSTGNAAFTMDGQPARLTDFSAGMQVSVLSNGNQAVSVSYEEDIKGPIDNVALDGSLQVMGQNVIVNADTTLNLPANTTLNGGDIVEVSGLRSADGSIVATYIELQSQAVDDYEVIGIVENFNAAEETFTIGALTISYQSAVLSDFPAEGLRNGDFVEVSDSGLSYEPGSLYLVASEIELETLDEDTDRESSDDSEEESDDHEYSSEVDTYEVEGLITSINTDTLFSIGNISFRISDETIFENGDKSGLVLDAQVEVKGGVDADGIIIAQEIEFH